MFEAFVFLTIVVAALYFYSHIRKLKLALDILKETTFCLVTLNKQLNRLAEITILLDRSDLHPAKAVDLLRERNKLLFGQEAMPE